MCNLLYATLVITHGDSSSYNLICEDSNMVVKDYYYNDKGIVGRALPQDQQIIYDSSNSFQQSNMRRGTQKLEKTAVVKPMFKKMFRRSVGWI